MDSTSHTAGVASSNPTVDFSWSAATDTGSGIAGYGIYTTTNSPGMPGATLDIGAVTSYSETLTPGTYYFNIRSVDVAGNWDSDYESFGPIIISNPTVVKLPAIANHVVVFFHFRNFYCVSIWMGNVL